MELAARRPLRVAIAIGGGDAVVERDATRPQQPRDCPEIRRRVRDADILVHADRDDLVVQHLPRYFAVILAADLDLPGEPSAATRSRA